MFSFRDKSFKDFDYILLILTILLCIFGIVVLKSATWTLTKNGYPVGASVMKSQIVSTVIGFFFILFFVVIDYKVWGKLYLPIYGICLLLLLIVKKFGVGAEEWGSNSWLQIGSFNFQPSEIVKIGLIISLGKMLEQNKENLNEPFTLIKILIFAFLPVGLIVWQPDLGTALVFSFFIAIMLYIAGIKWRYIAYAILLGLLMIPIAWPKLDNYQKNRILNFANPERDVSKSGYQIYQGKIALGSGKLTGRGLFKGVQTQNNFLPAKENDFIFSVLCEELGFVGGTFLLILYLLFLIRMILISKKSGSLFGSTMIIGFVAMFIFHIWENVGMNLGLMPVTGIPLPFVSQGGTFQLSNLMCVGLALSVSIHQEDLDYEIDTENISRPTRFI